MEFINLFKQFLSSSKSSKVTAKNYLSDLRNFINWYEKTYSLSFKAQDLDASVVDNFTRFAVSKYARSSVDRYLSTLRKFSTFLNSNGFLAEDPFKKNEAPQGDKWELRKFKDHLYIEGASGVSIKNYLTDVKQFLDWTEKVTSDTNNWEVKDIYSKLTENLIKEYKTRLISLNFSPLSINRKLSSIRRLVSWARKEKKLAGEFSNPRPEFPFSSKGTFIPEKNDIQKDIESIFKNQPKYSRLPPVRLFQQTVGLADKAIDFVVTDRIIDAIDFVGDLAVGNKKPIFRSKKQKIPRIQDPLIIPNIGKSFYDPLNLSTKGFPWYKKLLYFTRFSRPKWYLKYHNYPVVHYIHFSVLIIFMSILGFGLYQKYWGLNAQVLGTSEQAPSRILSIKQRLIDSAGNPIISPSDVRFAIYDDKEASGSSLLWEEVNLIEPDSNGDFSITVGQKNIIPSRIFTTYASLWLGLAVGGSEELRPRSQLAQVSYANNANTLQNMGIAGLDNSSNAILALDSSGNVTIGGTGSHTFQTIDAELVLSGNTLSLKTTAGSNSNIQLIPDGTGIIDIQRPIQNTSENNNLSSALGSVEFDDNVSILATTSAQAALIIHQNDNGGIINAFSDGASKFSVDSFGSMNIAGDLTLTGGNPKITSSFLDSGFQLGASGKGTLTLQPTSSGNIEFFSALNSISSAGDFKITGSFELASKSATTTFGGIKYSWPQSIGASGQFLKTNSLGELSWSSLPDLTAIWGQTGGNVGLGTTTPGFRLDIQDLKESASIAQIYNTSTSGTATGLNIKLGNGSATTNLNNKWITFEQAGIGTVGMIRGNGSNGITFQGNGVADFAEYLKKSSTETIDFGSVVCFSRSGLVTKCSLNERNIIGVSSESPMFLGGENRGEESVPVGLSGQVLTKVSNISGDIEPGDPITISFVPGIGIKATREGRIVGRAIDKFDSTSCSRTGSFGLIQKDEGRICEGKIYIVLNISHYEPTLAQKAEQFKNFALRIKDDGLYEVRSGLGEVVQDSIAIQDAIIASLNAGVIKAGKVVADSIEASDIRIDGIDMREYIAKMIESYQTDSSNTPGQETKTNVITPLGNKISVKLPEKSSFEVEDSSGSSILKVDEDDVTLSRNLVATNIEAQNIISNEASVSGTLRAGKIIADSIEGFEDDPNKEFMSIASVSSQLAYVDNLRALTGNFVEGLIVQAPSTFADLSVYGQLKVDNNLILASNSINVLGIDLELQPLRQGGISFMAGLIYIDTEGNARFGGNADFAKDVSVKGGLFANIISPLPDKDLIIDIGDKDKSFVVKSGTESAILSINKKGDLTASGSAFINKLNFNLVKPAVAVSPTEVLSEGSAGTATISAYYDEITIRNPLVTESSLIYITPKADTGGNVLYLLRQVPGVSFTVGIGTILNKEIPFNWIIIN